MNVIEQDTANLRSSLDRKGLRHANRDAAMCAAKVLERRAQAPHYVVRVVGAWLVTTAMPFLGEWYTADGVRHG